MRYCGTALSPTALLRRLRDAECLIPFLFCPLPKGVLDGWTSPVRKVSRARGFVGFDQKLRFRGVDLQECVQRFRRQERAGHGLIEHARDFFNEAGVAFSPGGADGANGDPWIGIADQQRHRHSDRGVISRALQDAPLHLCAQQMAHQQGTAGPASLYAW